MPNKPTTSPPPFGFGDASGFYTSGDRIGDPTRLSIPDLTNGYTPGVTIEPESFNFYVGGSILDWQTNWLALGSALAGLDAHIVETNADGLSLIASADFGGTSYTNTGVGAAVSITANTGAGTDSRALLVNAADGIGVEIVNSSSTNPALRVTNDLSGGGLPLQVQALSGGQVATFKALINDADGVDIDSRGTAKYGLRVRSADDGFQPLILDYLGATTPTRGAISMPDRGRPSSPATSDLWLAKGVSGLSRGGLEWEDVSGLPGLSKGTQRAWSSNGGLGYAHGESTGESSESVGTPTLKATVTLDSAGTTGTAPDGDYIVEWSAIVRPDDGGVPNIVVTVAGPGGFTETFVMVCAGNGLRVPVNFKKKFAFTGGPDTWTLHFSTATGGQNVKIEEASITVRGAYE